LERVTKVCGGQTGIRTLETVSRLHTFQACAFDHSATCPLGAFCVKLDQSARAKTTLFRPSIAPSNL
jgi:hypothetical protein